MSANMWIGDITRAKTPLRFILAISQPYKRYAFAALSFGMLADGIGSVNPLFYKYIVDGIVKAATGAGSYETVAFWGGVYLSVYVVIAILWRGAHLFGAHWAMSMRETGRQALFSYVLGHGHHYFENRFAGSVANKINHAIQGAVGVVEDVYTEFWPALGGFSVSFGIATWTNPLLGLLFFGWLVIVIPLNIYFARRRVPYIVAAQTLETKLRGNVIDILTNIRGVHEYAQRAREVAELQKQMLTRRDAGLRNSVFGEKVGTLNRGLQIIFMALMLATTVYLTARGVTTPGSIILIFSMMFTMGREVTTLSGRITSFAERYGEIEEGLDEILNPHDIIDISGAQSLEVVSGEIVFDRATFFYHGSSAPVIRDFSLTIHPKEKIGLVGRSGAGKSTLIKLLLRHYDLSGGAIRIDGVDIANVAQESLRKAIAIVPQESLLFHRPIRANIAYGRSDATQEEIIAAAKLAYAHEFIESLPLGYETLVGERGVKLSGGERQRVAIARAIIKNAPILLLDEATSSLDSESEFAIQKALHALMEGKTVIAIAHRLSTLREMDRIIVLDKGRIVEDGAHEELLKAGGIYAELWGHQAGGFLRDK